MLVEVMGDQIRLDSIVQVPGRVRSQQKEPTGGPCSPACWPASAWAWGTPSLPASFWASACAAPSSGWAALTLL